ncbi:MAG: right-handed parallel beta-helix repeat-containing protein [Planctomycetota bacterium]|nr:right-handed parallel beta-helix repeat-containing protein [Planctomycetota bacterium]
MPRTALALVLMLGCAVLPAGEANLRDYGARCDGVHDDTAAVQKALDALPPEGGTLVVPGLCAVGAPGILIEKRAKIVLKGVGEGAGFKHLSATKLHTQTLGPAVFLFRQCTECTVENLKVDGNNVAAAAFGFDRCEKCVVRNCRVENVAYPANAAMIGDGNRHMRIEGCWVEKTGRGVWTKPDGVKVPDATRGIWFGNVKEGGAERDLYVGKCTFKNTAATSIATHASGATIVENLIEDCACGPKLVPPEKDPGVNLVEKNVVRRSHMFHGLQLEGPGCKNITIRGNTFEDCANSGIYIYGAFENGAIEENVIRNNARNREGGWKGAIMFGHCTRSVVRNNRIEDTRPAAERTQDVGLMFNAAGPGAIKDVTVEGNTIAGQAVHGIVLCQTGGSIEGLKIAGNVFDGNAGFGILVEKANATNLATAGNTFKNTGRGEISDERAK